jgi:hypothetical protein
MGNHMNPETVTASQIVGALTAKQLAAITTVTFAVFGALASGGFWLGQQFAESRAAVQQAKLEGANAQLQAKLEGSEVRIQLLSQTNEQFKDAGEWLERLLEQKTQEVNKLAADLGRSNNCGFIHQQIRLTLDEMRTKWRMDPEAEQARRGILEHRLAEYQRQLGTCNK